MKIVQLSDIHVGSQFQPRIFDKVITEVNALKPDTIVITGDLTNEGLVHEYKECKRLVSKLRAKKIITIC
jgi:3',5'-cyclic AMP phosphodiesterase CpdA